MKCFVEINLDNKVAVKFVMKTNIISVYAARNINVRDALNNYLLDRCALHILLIIATPVFLPHWHTLPPKKANSFKL